MLLTVAGALLLAIAFDAGGVRLVVRIVGQFGPAVVGTALPLTAGIAAHGLGGLIFRRREGLEAVGTAPLDHSGVVALLRGWNLETD